MPQPAPDPLEDLRGRLQATREAAERLPRRRGAPRGPPERPGGGGPPQGWAARGDGRDTARELQALVAVLGSLREVIPPEIWEQVRDLVRQVLLVVRAILDHVVERLDSERRPRAAGQAPVEDIPIA